MSRRRIWVPVGLAVTTVVVVAVTAGVLLGPRGAAGGSAPATAGPQVGRPGAGDPEGQSVPDPAAGMAATPGTGEGGLGFTWPGTGSPPGVAGAAPVGLPVPGHGPRVIGFRVSGRASGLTGTVDVVLPAGYASAPASRRYPVLEAFAGYSGDQLSWIDAMSLGSFADAAAAAHRLGDVVIVSPQLEFPAGRDGECANGRAGQPQLETWLTRDLPTWVGSAFRVQTGRTGWTAIGISMGGFCAAMAAMRHPDVFGAAIEFGGYFTVDYGPRYRPWTPADPQWQYYDLVSLARHGDLPPLRMWVLTSPQDPLSYPATEEFLAQVRAPVAVTTVIDAGAGHSWQHWRTLLPRCLDWLGAQVPAFAPTA